MGGNGYTGSQYGISKAKCAVPDHLKPAYFLQVCIILLCLTLHSKSIITPSGIFFKTSSWVTIISELLVLVLLLLSRNPNEDCWGTIFCLLNYCFPLFAVMHRPLRVCQRQPGPLLDVILPSSFLFTSLSSTRHNALQGQGDFCQAFDLVTCPCHL
jgi:hypothetical protein